MSSSHAALTLLSAEITAVPGVGPSVAAKLRSLGIRTIRDLLFYFPRQHRDYSKLEKIANIPFGEVTTTLGLIWEVETLRTSKGIARTIATISDDTGKLRVTWFNQPYLQKQLQAAKGSYLVVTGVKQRFGNKIDFSVKSYELPDQGDLLNTGRLVPTYALTEGLNAKSLRRYTKWVVDRYAAMIPEYLPTSVRSAARLMPLPEAVSQMHYPENEQALHAARFRLGFDELFFIQLGMQERRSRWQQEVTWETLSRSIFIKFSPTRVTWQLRQMKQPYKKRLNLAQHYREAPCGRCLPPRSRLRKRCLFALLRHSGA